MSNFIFYDPNDPVVPNRVLRYLISVNDPDYMNLPNNIVTPNLSLVSGVSQNYWKVVDGAIVEMTTEEKASIDGFLAPKTKERTVIFKEIMMSAEQTTQFPRLLDALDKYPSFAVALDNYNYPLARSRLLKAKTDGYLTQEDYDLADSKIPT